MSPIIESMQDIYTSLLKIHVRDLQKYVYQLVQDKTKDLKDEKGYIHLKDVEDTLNVHMLPSTQPTQKRIPKATSSPESTKQIAKNTSHKGKVKKQKSTNTPHPTITPPEVVTDLIDPARPMQNIRVLFHMFTGLAVGVHDAILQEGKAFVATKGRGLKVFDIVTGKQINTSKPQFASFIKVLDEGVTV